MSDNNPRLRVEGLKKVFRKKTAVRDVSFEMREGEVVGLLGPNGAGKTTSFYMVVGFIKPTQGKIYLSDEEITSLPMYRRARMGISYLPQEPSVFSKLTVEKNIWAALEARNDISVDEKKEKLEGLIEDLGVEKVRFQKAYTLSGGERRRTEIARSLAMDPHFLLLDEPFAGIDPIAVYEIKNIISHLSSRGIGVLITDHNVRDTLEITDRSYIMNLGEIVVSGSHEELVNSEVARKIYLGDNFSM
ncbi:MAG: LPS export ABC transporter ATP-binding protein [Spirochaetales bacterium]|nr:LPS export ABC transporter ATP-binding protein [Spirochaetales bacterium]